MNQESHPSTRPLAIICGSICPVAARESTPPTMMLLPGSEEIRRILFLFGMAPWKAGSTGLPYDS